MNASISYPMSFFEQWLPTGIISLFYWIGIVALVCEFACRLYVNSPKLNLFRLYLFMYILASVFIYLTYNIKSLLMIEIPDPSQSIVSAFLFFQQTLGGLLIYLLFLVCSLFFDIKKSTHSKIK